MTTLIGGPLDGQVYNVAGGRRVYFPLIAEVTPENWHPSWSYPVKGERAMCDDRQCHDLTHYEYRWVYERTPAERWVYVGEEPNP